MENFKQGDLVEYYKKPTDEDWEYVGRIGIFMNIGQVFIVQETIGEANQGIRLDQRMSGWYPSQCFRLVTKELTFLIYN